MDSKNLGVSAQSCSQIEGPLSDGNFNTEGMFGSNRTFTITWSGAPSDASFFIQARGEDKGNSDTTTSSNGCYGSSGSVNLTIPYSQRGIISLYVCSMTDSEINIGKINVDSR